MRVSPAIPALGFFMLSAAFGQAAEQSVQPAFLDVVAAHFDRWDADHDGRLSEHELDAAAMDANQRGPTAAAVAALKRAARDPKLKLPPLTLTYLREAATAPKAAGKPDFSRMFAQGCERLASVTSHELFVGSPRLETIRQGKLGNCFSLAPLGAMVHRDSAQIVGMFARTEEGRYRVKFGKSTAVVAAPTDTEIALTSSNKDAGLWVNIYEKALGTALTETKPPAQRAGLPIDALAKGGSAGTMLSYLTGHDIARISFAYAKEKNSATPGTAALTEELRKQMTAAVAERRLMTCGTTTVSVPGLTPNHAYAVLDYDRKTDTVGLWNPHGDDFAPKGEPGLLNGYAKKSGVFRMPVSDWIAQFSGMAYELKPKNP